MKREEALMIAKPILFGNEMVQTILDGRKTQTRRPIKPQPISFSGDTYVMPCTYPEDTTIDFSENDLINFAEYQVGDILYVRETWIKYFSEYIYKTDYPGGLVQKKEWDKVKWRSPAIMPKEAARIFLKVKGVRVERVQDITEEEARLEGVRSYFLHKEYGGEWAPSNTAPFVGVGDELFYTRTSAFESIWNNIYAKKGYDWDSNPWVWVYDFERVEVV